jgi:hypothetical protein
MTDSYVIGWSSTISTEIDLLATELVIGPI